MSKMAALSMMAGKAGGGMAAKMGAARAGMGAAGGAMGARMGERPPRPMASGASPAI